MVREPVMGRILTLHPRTRIWRSAELRFGVLVVELGPRRFGDRRSRGSVKMRPRLCWSLLTGRQARRERRNELHALYESTS